MKDKSNIILLLLSAGKSSRFGSPKQLLKWKQSNLLQHAIKTAIDSNATDVFLVLGANYNQIMELTHTDSVEVIRNHSWDKGLGNSIAFGVNQILEKEIKVDGILLMLADQPLIDSEFLNAMIDTFEVGTNQIIASTYLNGKKGVPALFDSGYIKELSNLKGDKGAKILLDKYANKITSVDGGKILLDIDTIDDYEKLYKANHQ